MKPPIAVQPLNALDEALARNPDLTERTRERQSERTIENIYTHVRTRGAVGDAMPSLLKKK